MPTQAVPAFQVSVPQFQVTPVAVDTSRSKQLAQDSAANFLAAALGNLDKSRQQASTASSMFAVPRMTAPPAAAPAPVAVPAASSASAPAADQAPAQAPAQAAAKAPRSRSPRRRSQE